MSLFHWWKKTPVKGKTRTTVIVNDVEAAPVPNQNTADITKAVQEDFIQSLLHLGRQNALLHQALAASTLKNVNGGR
ncbi:hypothetical protein [Sinorhizobium meliloti]|uniref:hypothetical protein n=1 Tax=Rhizobium meliloti TaxID=382 RepID=UPI0001E4AB4B|nr:hypothetical protein [Sinorhizobium meliloti]AEG53128.1 hypothetical protein Sinme_1381 [Sinorhizobium meliloti AK83]MDE4591157.1 hypothetical protein [Sinorhizobium meliloti]SEI55726.1 hypothetical protein SAMN04244575_01029 [Sinorhizobium meliloti]